ncbi:MAG: hypothetical protein M1343_11520 [Chloroflexi bacterium]|nr:hypothetical protein [Chloroflexota bacterium]MDA8186905.1 hypothetical protein [Dehalococcoidales bacterium]
MQLSLQSSVEASCPWLAQRWDREQRGRFPSDDNACYLWDELGVPPDVVQYCAGVLPWHGERFVPVPVETQWSICLTSHYGSCRWLRQRQWHTRETTLVCPLLGSRTDRHQKYLYPCSHNACHARQPTGLHVPTQRRILSLIGIKDRLLGSKRSTAPIPAETQRTMCLSERYTECKIYLDSLPG